MATDITNINRIEKLFEDYYKRALIGDKTSAIFKSLGNGVILCCSEPEKQHIISINEYYK